MDHKKKKSVGNLFGYSSERSNSSPNLKSYLKDENNNSSSNLNQNEETSTNLQKVQSTPTSPLSVNNNNTSLNNSGNSIGIYSSSPTSSPIINSKHSGNKKPSRLAQAFKKVKHNNKLKKEIEELSNKTGLNQQYTRSNLPFNMIQNGENGSLDNNVSGHSRQNSKVSKKHQRKSRFIEPITQSTEDYSDIPRIIKLSIEYLFEKCLKVPGLFRESANALELQRLSQIFEKGEEIDLSDYSDPHCIGGLLKLYFRERPVAIFPYDLHKKIYNVLNEEDSSSKIRELLENGLLKGQYLILRYLFELLNSVHNNSEYNRMNYQNLAICFAPSLIQSYDTSCIDVIERLIDQYEAIFSVVVVVVDSNSNGGSIDLSSSPIKITESLVNDNNNNNNNSSNYTVVLDSSDILEQFNESYSSTNIRSSINSSNGVKKSPLLSSGNIHRKSISPKMNNRKSVNLKKISSDTLSPPSIDIQDENNEEEEEEEIVTRPRKNSSAIYLSRVGKNRPNSWNTNKKQPVNSNSTPSKRLHSVNGIDYNKPLPEPFDKSSIAISSNKNRGSLNKQMTIINTGNQSPSTPESDCTSIASDEDEELKISNIKPSLSRSSSINNLVEEVNKLKMDINYTNSQSHNDSNNNNNNNIDNIDKDTNNSNNDIDSHSSNQPILSTNYSNIEKPVFNYNRFLQPANRSLSNPNIKNFSVPSTSYGATTTSKYSKRATPTLFSSVRKQSFGSSKKNTYSGTPSPSFNSNNNSTISTPTSTSDLTSSVSSTSSISSINSGISSNNSSVISHSKTPSSTSSISSSASTTISPIRKVSHQHTNSLSSIGSSASSTTTSTTSSNNNSPSLTSSPIRPTLNHTVSASTLISKFNQIDNSSNTSNSNWKSGIEKQKQAPVKKSVAIFEKKS